MAPIDPHDMQEAVEAFRQQAVVLQAFRQQAFGLAEYRDALIGSGFTRDEAVRIVRDWQIATIQKPTEQDDG